MKNSKNLSVSGLLFIVFLVLKLTGFINWSWWWVTSPLWIPIVFAFSISIFLLIFALVYREKSLEEFKKLFSK
jgi:uncharacterized membrane protein YhdT